MGCAGARLQSGPRLIWFGDGSCMELLKQLWFFGAEGSCEEKRFFL